MPIKPFVRSCPQVYVGLEISCHNREPRVICLVPIEVRFSDIEQPGLFLEILYLLLYVLNYSSNRLVVREILVVMEILNCPFKVFKGFLKLLLTNLHLLSVPYLKFVNLAFTLIYQL